MSKLKIIRASAGSGKTYRITLEYLLLLFKYPKNFKHILAVTFTNKATEEMKHRIIEELYKLSAGKKSNYAELLKNEFNISDNELNKTSREILDTILHNYARLSITTIDSFFQRIIKSFAREAGLQFNFEVELDINEVIEKAVEQMLANLNNNPLLIDWLTNFAEKRVDEGKNWDFKKEIIKLGKQLFNESFNSFPLSYHHDIENKELLKSIYNQLNTVYQDFETTLTDIGKKGLQMMSKYDVHPHDFKYGKVGSVGMYFIKLKNKNFESPKTRILDACKSIEEWLPKDKNTAAKISDLANAGLFNMLNSAVNHISEKKNEYNSAKAILENFYALGILSDLLEEVSNYRKQKNIFLLAQAGQFLKAIIDDNDAPFIYEKTGQTYFHYMIDEFQDTSGIQWNNFKPLVINSLSSNNKDILVGDIKQSIYRWRNSDWKIMAHEVAKDVAEMGSSVESLNQNWRSTDRIISFNNSCFPIASQLIQNELNITISESSLPENEKEFFKSLITSAYDDCRQLYSPKTPQNAGWVKVQFLDNKNKDWTQQSLQCVSETIEKLLKAGQQPRDIAILVRTARHGREIIEYLNQYNEQFEDDNPLKFQVLSSESAFIVNSKVVRLIIGIFKFLAISGDKVNAAKLANDYCLFAGKDISQSRFSCKDVLPDEFLDQFEALKLLTPQTLFEQVVNIFELNKAKENLPFLQAFNDCLIKYENSNSSSLLGFLQYLDEKKNDLSVSVSDEQNAVRVLTIHKSKGLEFQSVIIPFCDWSFDHSGIHAPLLWGSSSIEPFNALEFFPVKYSALLAESVFSHNYILEKAQSFVDNLNLLYVAFTRAVGNLVVCCPMPEKSGKPSSIASLLFDVLKIPDNITNQDFPKTNLNENWIEDKLTFEFGAPWVNIEEDDEDKSIDMPLAEFGCNPLSQNLKQRPLIAGFWENAETNNQSNRGYGNVMHQLFQEIYTFSDIPKATAKAVREGLIQKNEIEALENELKSLLNNTNAIDWFSGVYKTLNENAIIIPSQHTYRPDRVMISDEKVIIVDYKFGKKQSNEYNQQVEHYAFYISQMGYKKVEGYVWYVNLNVIEQVNTNAIPLES